MHDWLFLQSNVDVHERIAAMRGDYDDGSRTMEFLITAGAFIVILGSLLYVYRKFAQKISAKAKERAGGDMPWVQEHRSEAEIKADALQKLADVEAGATCWLFWGASGERKGSAAKLETVRGVRAVFAFKGDERPSGMVRLVTPSSTGPGIQLEMTVRPGSGARLMLELAEGTGAIEIGESVRARTGLKAAAAPLGSGDTTPFALRVIDISQSGIGILCDQILSEKSRYRLKVALPDRSQKISLDATVAWSEEGTGGIHRGGLNFDSRNFAQDAMISDFLREDAQRGAKVSEDADGATGEPAEDAA